MNDRSHADRRRRAGLVIPLFSCTSSRSWGVGEITDIPTLARWLRSAGLSVLQLLPVNEMAPGQQSPYSAISAMAIDPIYIGIEHVPEFAALGPAALGGEERTLLDKILCADRVDYPDVRRLKGTLLRRCFDRFVDREWTADSARAAALRRFIERESWWLDEYTLFRALHACHDERAWTEWPAGLRERDADALAAARRDLARDILFRSYLQWLAQSQWEDVRDGTADVSLYGDLPFMVDGDSADVWSRQDQFRLDVSVGVPPDAFSATGQDWGMPVYRWDVLGEKDYGWVRNRARRSAALYRGYRIDHLVGFYRTYGRPRDGSEPFFSPAQEADQLALGERLLEIFRSSGAEIVAEDLGTVPDFVRASLARLEVPGFRVLRWERRWHDPGQPFREPADYPPISVAASGTHDTEPLAVWWERADEDEKQKISELQVVQTLTGGRGLQHEPFDVVRDVLLEALFGSGSDLLLLPIQDVFGWRDRINEPATVSDRNWSFRLPWPVDRLDTSPEAMERRDALRRWSHAAQREA